MAERKRLPDTRRGVTQHFTIIAKNARHDDEEGTREIKGYIQSGEYEDGTLGEVFVKVGKPGCSDAWYDEWATAISIGLQYGAPVDVLLRKHLDTRFQPSGAVLGVKGILRCTSPLDLICRFLINRYGTVQT